MLYEERVDIDYELSVMVARNGVGETKAWPAVETVQKDGICHEVLYPGAVTPEVAARARTIAMEIAEAITLKGVMAVEMFASKNGVLINEIACRPHNSGHWSIEGATTSQFEAHLRAVCSLPVGTLEPLSDEIASVNILGGSNAPEAGLSQALAVLGAHVHLYAKAWREGRKLGHVTCLGAGARTRAWQAARALGVR
jgi:5-(carboxyamino)imidazole ribonucleotide synthase